MNPLIKTIRKERHYTIIAALLLVGLVALYMYLVSATIMHVVVRKEVNQSISQLHSAIGSLEADYIAAQHRISTELALQQGYVETTNKIFIDRTPTALVLSRNDE